MPLAKLLFPFEKNVDTPNSESRRDVLCLFQVLFTVICDFWTQLCYFSIFVINLLVVAESRIVLEMLSLWDKIWGLSFLSNCSD